MVKKFSLNCNAGSEQVAVDFYVGNPQDNSHPIGFQMKFLSQKGVTAPEDIVKSLTTLHDIAKKNRIPFEDLLEYVSDKLRLEGVVKECFNKASEFSGGKNNSNPSSSA